MVGETKSWVIHSKYTKQLHLHASTQPHNRTHTQTRWLRPNSKSNWASFGGYCVPCHWKWVGRGGKSLLQMLENGVKYLMNGQPLFLPQTLRICNSGINSRSAVGCILHQCALHSVAHQRILKYCLLEPVN